MININNLCFSYNGTTPYQLDNINLSLPCGSFVSVLGENGSFKTTFVKLLLGHLTPIKGKINMNTSKIGYVPQKIDNFNPHFTITVYELLKCHLRALKIKDLKEIDKVLNAVNMIKFKNSLIGSLSGGQQQRIFIARALIGNPNLLILDELSTGIDEKTQLEVYNLIASLNKSKNLTIVSVEHNLNRALDFSSHILKFEDGNCKLYNKKDFLNKPNVKNYVNYINIKNF